MGSRRALAGAFLVLSACRQDVPQGSSATASASVIVTASAAPSGSAAPTATLTVSQWEDANTPQPVELANAPDRAAIVVFDALKGGYIVQRGGQSRALPREWFGAGPPRRDISLDAAGRQLAVPDGDAAIVIYDVEAKRWLKRLDAPEPGAKGKMSADGRHVVWTSFKGACSMTEIATGTPNKKCS